MLSAEFSIILDRALGLAEIKSRNPVEAAKVAAEIRRRAKQADRDGDTLQAVVIEPSSLAQEIGVTTDSVEFMAEELRSYGAVHQWVRVLCPNLSDDDYRVIVETDDPNTLQEQLKNSCHFCGQIHDHIGWGDVETVYSLNFDQKPEGNFDFIGFF